MTSSLLLRLADLLGFRFAIQEPSAAHGGRSRRGARTAIASFVIATITLSASAMLLLDDLRPGIRDPEYARRVTRYRARLAENPGRPVAMVVGSSRTAMGVSPADWEASRPATAAPLLFNMSLLGSGPVMELMVVNRVFADGLRPPIVLLEYWPPYLYSEGKWTETQRIGIERLSPIDQGIVRDYFPNPTAAEARMRPHRWNPLWASRERLMIQIFPRSLPNKKRIDWMWEDVDGWGWKPGFDYRPGLTAERAGLLATCREIYRPLFADFRISEGAERAIREAVAIARAHGAQVGLVFLPESSEFRSWYPPEAERLSREHLASIRRELGVPVINARDWIDDSYFVDGFHLSRVGAGEFTRKLGPAVTAAFPEVRP